MPITIHSTKSHLIVFSTYLTILVTYAAAHSIFCRMQQTLGGAEGDCFSIVGVWKTPVIIDITSRGSFYFNLYAGQTSD